MLCVKSLQPAKKYQVVADIQDTCTQICPLFTSVQGVSKEEMGQLLKFLFLLCPTTVSTFRGLSSILAALTIARYYPPYPGSYWLYYGGPNLHRSATPQSRHLPSYQCPPVAFPSHEICYWRRDDTQGSW